MTRTHFKFCPLDRMIFCYLSACEAQRVRVHVCSRGEFCYEKITWEMPQFWNLHFLAQAIVPRAAEMKVITHFFRGVGRVSSLWYLWNCKKDKIKGKRRKKKRRRKRIEEKKEHATTLFHATWIMKITLCATSPWLQTINYQGLFMQTGTRWTPWCTHHPNCEKLT
jgi:hypothetical protein